MKLHQNEWHSSLEFDKNTLPSLQQASFTNSFVLFETVSNWKLLALKNAIKPVLSYLKEERSRFYENALLSWTPNSIILRLPLSSYQFTEGMLLSHSWRAIVNDSWIKLKCFSFGILGQNHSILICKIAGASFIFKPKAELSSPPRKFPGNPQTWSGH